MFITRECDYAVRTVRELADGEKKTVKEICDKEHIPFQYAYKILKKLEKGGIVKSYRGAQGGYALDRGTDEISLFDIFISVEDQLYVNECLKEDFECPLNRDSDPCKVHSELCNIQKMLFNSLKEKSMAEILK